MDIKYIFDFPNDFHQSCFISIQLEKLWKMIGFLLLRDELGG